MRYISGIITLVVAVSMLSLGSCVKNAKENFNNIENRSLRAWMLKNRPELVDNYQEDGNYYVEVLDPGVADSVSILDVIDDEKQGSCWVFFNITGRSLYGDVCMTRSEIIARMQGSFSKSTHYVPYFRFMGAENISLMEGTYLAMKNTLKLGSKYVAENQSMDLSTEFEMRYGTKLRLYLPSAVVSGSAETTETGGYEGQYVLDGNKPMIMDVEIVNRVNNPLAYEGEMLEGFGEGNGGVVPIKENSSSNKSAAQLSLQRSLEQHQSSGSTSSEEKAWRHVQDTIPGIIVNTSYVPDADKPFDYAFRFRKNKTDLITEYTVNKPYTDTDLYKNGPTDIDKKINEALIKRFGKGSSDGALVGDEGSARIWYIGRFLDGFIFDTNIDEVKQIIYGKVEESGAAISYSTTTSKDDYITAWFYTIPELRHDSWATFVTTSSFAYGVSGLSGSSTTTTSTDMSGYYDYMNYMNYYNYYNTYYGNGYNNNYYMNYYNYNNFYGTPSVNTSTSSTTKTTVSTEILPYTPLIFQVYIEEDLSIYE